MWQVSFTSLIREKINLQLIQLLKSVIVRDDLTLTITLFYVTEKIWSMRHDRLTKVGLFVMHEK